MNALRIKKSFLILAVALFAIIIISATISLADDSITVVQGTIVSADPNSGKVAVITEAGKAIMLDAGPENDLKAFQKGDEVTIEYDKNSVIQSINFQN